MNALLVDSTEALERLQTSPRAHQQNEASTSSAPPHPRERRRSGRSNFATVRWKGSRPGQLPPVFSRYLNVLETCSDATLRRKCRAPRGADLCEWLTTNLREFFQILNLLWSISCEEECTAESCPRMTAGEACEYLWQDVSSAEFAEPRRVPAREYVERLFTWVELQLEDESLFPEPGSLGQRISPSFLPALKTIFRRLLRVYAHIYRSHFPFREIRMLSGEEHFNSCFRHFIYFCREHDLVDAHDSAPIKDIVDRILALNSAP
eukprot:tig00021721_g23216.t1